MSEPQTKGRRILRRGIPFGPAFDPAAGRGHGIDAERGLVFQCYQASLADQFVFLQQAWINASDFPIANTGRDPIIGEGGAVAVPGSAPAFGADLQSVRTHRGLSLLFHAVTAKRSMHWRLALRWPRLTHR